MKLPRLLPLFASLAFAVPAFAQNAEAPAPQTATDATLLNLDVSAEASHAPDVATISSGVLTQAADGNAAMRANAVQMDKLLAAIKSAGIADRDVQTSGINLNPQYAFEQNKPPVVTGYQARNTVSLKVRDIGKLGKVLDALAAAGASELNGPNFGIDDPEPLYAQARLDALKKAQARAETYANALGLRVRRIVRISEGGGNVMRPMPMMRATAMKADAETPVAAGETSVSVNLDVVFELGK